MLQASSQLESASQRTAGPWPGGGDLGHMLSVLEVGWASNVQKLQGVRAKLYASPEGHRHWSRASTRVASSLSLEAFKHRVLIPLALL